MGAFTLLDQLVFYGSYHNNKWNILIHMIFVPTIWWSSSALLQLTGPLIAMPAWIPALFPIWIGRHLEFNAGFIGFLFYASYYMTLGRPGAAIAFNTVMLAMYCTAHQFNISYGADAWKYALALKALSWYMQIHPGHMICEGRRPALMDSLFQSIVLAPFFVWFELLFFFGYDKPFQKQLNDRIHKEIGKYRASLKKKSK